MAELRVTLVHRDALQVPCSMLFVKHIEGSLSAPEIAIDEALNGSLRGAYAHLGTRDDIEVASAGAMPFAGVHALVFHRTDLPFTYASVDRYARRILQTAIRRRRNAPPMTSIATAVHGPGAGLDTPEALETLLTALASELTFIKDLGNLRELIIVEKDKRVFERLVERLKHLENKGILRVDGDGIVLHAVDGLHRGHLLEADALQQRALRHVFVAMPFAKEFNNLYYFGIKDPVEKRAIKCERVDQEQYVGDVVDRIRERIDSAELVIADITGANANVFFEVGFAEGRGKAVILLSQAQAVPFDLRARNQIRYDPLDLLSLSRALGDMLDALLPASPPLAPTPTQTPPSRARRRR